MVYDLHLSCFFTLLRAKFSSALLDVLNHANFTAMSNSFPGNFLNAKDSCFHCYIAVFLTNMS